MSYMTRLSVTAEARLRAKSQLTLPEAIVDAAGVRQGDRFLVEISPAEPDIIRLQRIPASYAGALRDLFGDPGDYLASERDSWRRP